MKQSLFDMIGGLSAMERIHTSFYDKVYAHPWLGQFFEGLDQKFIELRQTQFMAEKMGSKAPYLGKDLDVSHMRMYITEELLVVRQGLLREAIEEEGVAPELVTRWLKIDRAFWSKIKKDSLESFKNIDLKYEQPMIVEKPES
ncbi:group 1 truncated hemoglobin [Mariprofundus sp. EBB-1]|uniref:group I truncated hemoglobin n=1 Tax=Mariprofundus sp. EBB-1 TaxID=2650971 RepID=UPI000EF28749|nr:group 1 truncated hemoglobin [Mariprofundus sp. EBB-1]RLL53696.1 group 1 truncated hemoglobin [Mariprofundus sp. EBB-1]